MHRLFTWLWFSLAALVILAAVALSGVRLLLPLMGDYQVQIETQIEQRLGRQVTVAAMDAAWRGLGPSLKLHQVEIWDEEGQEVVLLVEEAWMHLDLLASLTEGTLKTRGASLVGLELDLLRHADGRIVLQGFSGGQRADAKQALQVLLSAGDLALRETQLRWRDRSGRSPPLELHDLQLQLHNDGDEHRISASAQLPALLGGEIALVTTLRGPGLEFTQWQGEAFVELNAVELDAWSDLFPATPVQVGGQLDLKLWLNFAQGAWRQVAGEFAARQPRLARIDTKTSAAFSLDALQGRVLWEAQEQGWQLQGEGVRPSRGAEDWPETRFRLQQQRPDADTRLLAGAADHVDLALVAELLRSLPVELDPGWPDVAALAPAGRLDASRFSARWQRDELQQFHVKSDFTDLRSNPWAAWPGVEGISGHVEGGLEAGSLRVDKMAQLALPRLFRAPLRWDRLAGELRWQRAADRWRFEVGSLALANADVALSGRAELDLPRAGQEPQLEPFLNLYLDVERADAARTGQYLPAHIMNPKAVSWLDRALVAGQVRGGVVFHGPLQRFPFDAGEGRFEVRLDVTQAVLDYAPGWQPIEDLQAEVVFDGAGMDIRSQAGRIADGRLGPVRTHTEDLRAGGGPLRIEGQVDGTLAGMLDVLQASPLGDRYRGLTQGIAANGDAELQLGLTIPLRKHHGTLAVRGDLGLRDNRLASATWGLALEQVQGRVRFTEDSIGSKDLQAQLWGRPLDVELTTPGSYHQLRFSGAFGLVEQARQWQWPVADYLEGSSDWQADILIHHPRPGQPSSTELLLASELRGVAVKLPPPFAKPAEQARGLRVRHSLYGAGPQPLRLSYGDNIHAVLEMADAAGGQGIQRGELRFGPGPAQLPDRPALRVAGIMERLTLADWQALLPKGAADATGMPALELDLQVSELELQQRLLRQVGLNIHKQGSDWTFRFTGPNADGDLQLQEDTQGIARINLTMKHLRVETLPAAEPGVTKLAVDPTRLPALHIRVQELEYDQALLGALDLQTQRSSDGMRVERLRLVSPDYDFSAQGDWRIGPGDREVSRFRLQLKDGDLGNLLDRFGYDRTMESSKANALLVANWPGSPFAFSLERVEGNLDVDIGSGNLVKVNAPAGRALSVLSMHSLQRRLALDFSDLFGKGFSFDEIKGHFTFIEGDSYTNDLSVTSPSAQIDISGRTGFVSKDYDQLITITPRVTSNLPLAGALAGGPAVGAALFVAERLFGGRVDKLARYQYEVTGPWDDPSLARSSVGPLSLPGKDEAVQ